MNIKHFAEVSPRLIRHIRWVYEGLTNDHVEGYTEHALPMYVLAVASVEAFVNEACLSFPAKLHLSSVGPNDLFDKLGAEWYERIGLRHKLILVPQVLFGQSFSKSGQPYQDMALLITVRNEITHYKMREKGPKCFKDLEQRGISLPKRGAWAKRLSSVQGIRWAHDTACATVRELVGFVTVESYRELLEEINLPSFEPIA